MSNFTIINSTNVTSFVDFITYGNTVTAGAMGPAFLLLIFVVAFVAQKQFITEKALVSSAFITTISAYLMFTMGIINETWFIISLPILILAIVIMMISK